MQKYVTIASMTYNDFSCRINLPSYCQVNGIKGYEFIRMPRFGWFAVENATGKINTLIDFVPIDEIVPFCTDLILQKTQFHEEKIFYSEVSVARLCNDIRIMLALNRLQSDAALEFKEGRATTEGKTINLAKMYTDNGMQAFLQTGVGYMSQSIFKTYQKLLGLANSLCNRLILPSWYTPQHIASFESSAVGNPLKYRFKFYVNGEAGWYGRPEKAIVNDLKQLLTQAGCTWDPKLNFWTRGTMQLDESLTPKQLLEIWSKNSHIRFKQDPLDALERINGVGQIKDHIQTLTFNQVSELEKRFKVNLASLWKTQKHQVVRIGNLTFVAKDMRYYVESFTGIVEITNFAIEIHQIKKQSNNQYYRSGIIYYEGKQEPFEMPNEYFLSTSKFITALTEFFLDRGLGVPIISNSYRRHLLELINRLNMSAMIHPGN